MNEVDLRHLIRDVFEIAAVTRHADWANPDGSLDPKKMAKAIPPLRWKEALDLALELDRAVRALPRPTLGADEYGGHAWLNYVCGTTTIQVAVKDAVKGVFEWTILRGAERHVGSPPDLINRTEGIRSLVQLLQSHCRLVTL